MAHVERRWVDLPLYPMSDTALDRLVDRFLTHHAAFNPVDATFMGLPGHDLAFHRPVSRRQSVREGITALMRTSAEHPWTMCQGNDLMRACCVPL